MRKKVPFIATIILFLFQLNTGYCQFMGVDTTEEYTINDLSGKYKLTKERDSVTKRLSYLTWTDNMNTVNLLQFLDNKCFVCTMIPLNQNAVNAWISTFNQYYVKISDAEWNAYIQGKIFMIKLEYKGASYSFTVIKKVY